jgi:hypothetical protein
VVIHNKVTAPWISGIISIYCIFVNSMNKKNVAGPLILSILVENIPKNFPTEIFRLKK